LPLSLEILRLGALHTLTAREKPEPAGQVLTLSSQDSFAEAQQAFLETAATHARLTEDPDFYFTPLDLQRLAWSKLRSA
jgi:hypothetical protein